MSRPHRPAFVHIWIVLVMALLTGATPLYAAPSYPDGLRPFRAGEPAGAAEAATPRSQIFSYEVHSGDSLWDIAVKFDLDVETLRWSNPELAANPDMLSLGQVLTILPTPGAYVTVARGDTLERLAERWGVRADDITGYPLNGLAPGKEPAVGAQLVIPYGRREVKLAPPGPASGYAYAWPIRGVITQGYWSGHRAVDFGAPYGAKVYAARSGRCIFAGLPSVQQYGYLVILDHGDGSQTYSSHLKGAWVQAGDWVARGDLIGEVGSTGNSTGPHVHFELRSGGALLNPLLYLPPEP